MTDHTSYLSRHRPICTVIQLAIEMAEKNGDGDMLKLLNEAKDYAQRMSARLMEYKRKETGN